MRPRKRTIGIATTLASCGLLGAALIAFPAIAGSETTPAVSAVEKPGGVSPGEEYAWSPEQQTVAQGSSVTFSNGTPGVPHGVVWSGGPGTPSCSGVPIDKGEEGWKGSCTFTQEGTYTFHCFVHPYMHGTIVVTGKGASTTTTTSTQSSTSTTSAGPPPKPKGHDESETGVGGLPGSPFAGSGAKALLLASSQHGGSVHGSVAVSRAGAGGRLEVQLLAGRASLAKAPHSPKVRVGRLVHGPLRAGRLSFTVGLSAAAKRALRIHHSLALIVKVTLTPSHGAAVTLVRKVTVQA